MAVVAWRTRLMFVGGHCHLGQCVPAPGAGPTQPGTGGVVGGGLVADDASDTANSSARCALLVAIVGSLAPVAATSSLGPPRPT